MLKIYSIFDSKAEGFNTPWFSATKGLAIRSFTEAANDSKTSISMYPHDFALFELGEFNPSNAQILLHKTPVHVGLASEFIKPPVVDVRKVSNVVETENTLQDYFG